MQDRKARLFSSTLAYDKAELEVVQENLVT